MNYEIFVQNGPMVYQPAIEGDITWATERKGSPGKLVFTAVQDSILNIQEGNAVQFNKDGQEVFYGYIFKKSFGKDRMISITCYDQLRYFKNKDTYVYAGKTCDQVVRMMCGDFGLRVGNIENTGYVIPKRLESNKTLFDIVQNALDVTLTNTKRLFVLYDEYGQIMLKNIASMKVPILIDEETGLDFDYTSSIDSQTYNQIKLVYENKETGMRDIYMTKDTEHINEWGVLQYFESLQEGENGTAKAEALLQLYNRKTRNLTVKDAFGDLRIRAGASPMVRLNLGDVALSNFMVCDKVTHKFKANEHTMDLTLIGGDFIV